jgi:hydrogenase maturation factor
MAEFYCSENVNTRKENVQVLSENVSKDSDLETMHVATIQGTTAYQNAKSAANIAKGTHSSVTLRDTFKLL